MELIATESGWRVSERLPPEEWAKVKHLFFKGMIFDEGEPVEVAYLTNSRAEVSAILGIPDKVAEKKAAEIEVASAIADDRAELESIFADQLCDTNMSCEFYEGGLIQTGKFHNVYMYFRQTTTSLKCVGAVLKRDEMAISKAMRNCDPRSRRQLYHSR